MCAVFELENPPLLRSQHHRHGPYLILQGAAGPRLEARPSLRRGFLGRSASSSQRKGVPTGRNGGSDKCMLEIVTHQNAPATSEQQPDHLARVARDLQAQTACASSHGSPSANPLRIVPEAATAEAAAAQMMSCDAWSMHSHLPQAACIAPSNSGSICMCAVVSYHMWPSSSPAGHAQRVVVEAP